MLLSPSADCALRPNIASLHQNTRSDYVATRFEAAYGVKVLLGLLSPDELDKSWLSLGSIKLEDAALEGMFKPFPPTFTLAGEAEISRDSIHTLRDRMGADMEDYVTYLEVANAPHDLLASVILEPERSEALREIAKWAAALV